MHVSRATIARTLSVATVGTGFLSASPAGANHDYAHRTQERQGEAFWSTTQWSFENQACQSHSDPNQRAECQGQAAANWYTRNQAIANEQANDRPC